MSETLFPLPEDAKPWPRGIREPEPHAQPVKAKNIKDGRYFSTWPDGGIRVFGLFEEGWLVEWIYFHEEQDSGYARSDRWPWCAQYYYANGTAEDFNMWDDSSRPYDAGMTFEEWVKEQVASMLKWAPRRR
ncbi:MAG: hypothetical protein RDV48_21000 [Candidatus Eremiobacteraeota bacterium]|nr:hypothetical protein [Candidatus Eremiobacteraeota bacterium]